MLVPAHMPLTCRSCFQGRPPVLLNLVDLGRIHPTFVECGLDLRPILTYFVTVVKLDRI